MPLQARHSGNRRVSLDRVQNKKFTVTAITDTCFACPIPQITAGWKSDVEIALRRVRIFFLLIMAVIQRPHFLDEICGIGAHAPFMAIGANLAFDIKIVEQNELASELMVIRGDLLREEAQVRITVAL